MQGWESSTEVLGPGQGAMWGTRMGFAEPCSGPLLHLVMLGRAVLENWVAGRFQV